MKKYFLKWLYSIGGLLIVLSCSKENITQIDSLSKVSLNYKFPSAITNSANFITDTSAECSGEAKSNDTCRIISRGFCWSTAQHPLIGDSMIEAGTGNGVYTATLPNLKGLTKYYYRAFAITAGGIGYGEDGNFTTTEHVDVYYMKNGYYYISEAKFYDSGGPLNDYSGSENYIITFYPVVASKKLRAVFSSFSTQESFDVLYIYNGPGISSNQLTGSGSPMHGNDNLHTFTATNPQGALTFKFISNSTTNQPGWSAYIETIN